eukprot:scaffold2455_cov387-Prasinococcus_capsulatus_cf.AAC.9
MAYVAVSLRLLIGLTRVSRKASIRGVEASKVHPSGVDRVGSRAASAASASMPTSARARVLSAPCSRRTPLDALRAIAVNCRSLHDAASECWVDAVEASHGARGLFAPSGTLAIETTVVACRHQRDHSRLGKGHIRRRNCDATIVALVVALRTVAELTHGHGHAVSIIAVVVAARQIIIEVIEIQEDIARRADTAVQGAAHAHVTEVAAVAMPPAICMRAH